MARTLDRPPGDLVALFDRLARLGWAVERAEKKKTGLESPVAKHPLKAGQKPTGMPAADRDSTPGGEHLQD